MVCETRTRQGRQDFRTLFAMKEEIRGAVKARPGSFPALERIFGPAHDDDVRIQLTEFQSEHTVNNA